MKKLIFLLILCFQISYAQWEPCNNGLFNKQVISLAACDNNIFVGTYRSGIFVSGDLGNLWKNIGLTNKAVNSLVISNNVIVAGTTSDYGIWFSSDSGSNWKNAGFIADIWVIATIGNKIFAGTDKGGLLSLDNGQNWSSNGIENTFISSFTFNENKIFTGTYNEGGIYLSTDNGDSWSNTGLKNEDILTLTVSDNNVFAGTNYGGVYKSSDDGKTWKQKNNGLNTYRVNSFAVSGKYIYAGTNDGVYITSDQGESWVQKNSGLTVKDIYPLIISGDYIFAGTDNGVFRRNLTEMTDVESKEDFYLQDKLDGANVDILVYNLLGSIVVNKNCNNYDKSEIENTKKRLMPGCYIFILKTQQQTFNKLEVIQ